MKLNILAKINADWFPEDGYTYITPDKLSTIENESCEDIILTNTLEYMPNRNDILVQCMNKMRKNSTISLIGIDVMNLATNLINGNITIDEFNNVLFGKEQKSIGNIFQTITLMKNYNLDIIDKKIAGLTYYIKAKK
jgi:hypothetical protein